MKCACEKVLGGDAANTLLEVLKHHQLAVRRFAQILHDSCLVSNKAIIKKLPAPQVQV